MGITSLIKFAAFLAISGLASSQASVIPTNQTGILGIVLPLPRNCVVSENAVISKIEVTSCTTQPCLMYPGSTYDVSVTFTPSTVTTYAHYYLYFIPSGGSTVTLISVGLPDTFRPGGPYTVPKQVIIPTSMRRLSGDLRLEIVDVTANRFMVSRCIDVMIGQ